jgi:hypothetical protein
MKKLFLILFVLISTGLFAQNIYKTMAFKEVEPKTLKTNISKMILGYVTYEPYKEIITKPTDIMTVDVGVSLAYYLIQNLEKNNYLSKSIPNILFTKKGTILIVFSKIENTWSVDFIPDKYFLKAGKNGIRCLTAIETKELINILTE